MLLKTLKEQMLLPDKEILINKYIRIKDIHGTIVSLTSQNGRNMLWAIYHIENSNTVHDENTNYLTNKDEMISNISKHNLPNTNLSEIIIQNQKLIVTSSSTSMILDDSFESIMQLQHFFENGLSLDIFGNININNLCIASYEFKDNFPDINLSNKLNISLTFSETTKEIPIHMPLTIDFNAIEKDKRLSFYDPINKKECFFYVNNIKHYDIWKEAENYFKSEKIENFLLEQIEELKKEYFNNLEDICENGMNLLILEYETQDNLQLNFYTKEYLNSPPVNNNSFTIMLFKPEEKIGPNGFFNRVSSLKQVHKDFNSSTSLELFSFILTTPSETIHI